MTSTDAELRRLIGPSPEAGRWSGIEHEFRVIGPSGPLDFRPLLGAAPPDGLAIVPDDPRGYRCRGGGLLTADGDEAEIATSPVAVRPGFTAELDQLVRLGHGRLRAQVAPHLRVEGWSTHLNVEVADDAGQAVALLLASRFASSLMLLMDRSESPGLLVRPRPSRIELGGEYVVGDQLRAAMLMAAAATLVCERAVSSRLVRPSLPRRLQIELAPARARFGYYVDRAALGTDLYERGRTTGIRTRWHRTTTAQEQLENCWAAVRDAAIAIAAPEELAVLDATVAGELPLPLERPSAVPGLLHGAPPEAGADPLDPVLRPGFRADATVATWSFTVHRITGSRSLYVCVPARDLRSFHAALRDGRLDGTLTRALAASPTDRVLRSSDQTDDVGVFDRMGDPALLTPEERDPRTGLPFGGGGGRSGRQAKRRAEPPSVPPVGRAARSARRMRPVVLVAAGLVVALAVGATAFAVTRGGSHKTPAAIAKTTTTSPPSSSTTTTGPFSPSAGQLAAVRMAGTYDLVRTVVKSDNITAKVGTTERRVYHVSSACSAKPPCTFSVSGATPADAFTLPFDGRIYSLDSRSIADCYDANTGKTAEKGGALAIFHQELRATEVQLRRGVLIATTLAGTAFLTAEKTAGSTCGEIRPITYSAVATLRG